jgi:hypothetical protein
MSYVFRNPSMRAFQKKYDTAPRPFPTDQKNSITIGQWGVFDGDQIFSFTISHTPTIK